jgi:hypothetical protein
MIEEIKELLKKQEEYLVSIYTSYVDAKDVIFESEDVVEQYLRDKCISEEEVDLESLRDFQFETLDNIIARCENVIG